MLRLSLLLAALFFLDQNQAAARQAASNLDAPEPVQLAASAVEESPFQRSQPAPPRPPPPHAVERNPFGEATKEDRSRDESVAGDCGPESTLARAELRKPEIAARLCRQDYAALDDKWIFILYYVKGFNEFLEERGSYIDSTGACARAAEPRRALGLIYKVIDTLQGKGDHFGQDAEIQKMLRPFREDWRRIPFVLYELSIWQKEGGLDAASVASRNMCSDPAFELFWSNAIQYAMRLPGARD